MPTWPIPTIKELLEPTLNHMGYALYALEQSGQSGRTLRISIDHTEPITIEDCERVSRVAGPLIDPSRLIDGSYDLEVSSPGAERPLREKREYERFSGRRVNVRYRSGDSETVVEGQLVAVDGAGIAVSALGVRGRAPVIVHIAWDDVVTGRLVRADGSESIRSLPAEDFKRMAAQTAKHAVLRHIHDLERDKVLRDVAEHRGELASGVVDRSEGGTVYVDLGRAEGVMPPEEQIPGEQLQPGRPVLVVILEPQNNRRQAQVRVSRAGRAFVHRLLEAEVPEIKAGTVQVRAIAREPGLRTKIAVSSSEPSLDPVGACVGPKGVRHRAILSELANEHVDIVPWSEDPEAFVAAALGPAKADRVTIDRVTRTATVLVPKHQLSLAIGRDGQNARLAAKLTGLRIDIKASETDEAPAPAG